MAKRLIATLNDSTLFLREWFANPQRTGSVAPSSPKLAAAMARWLPSDPESYVLELGPGTGAVTQALIERGLREDRLVAIENNPETGAPAPQALSRRPHHHRRRVASGRSAAGPRRTHWIRRRGHFQPAAVEFPAAYGPRRWRKKSARLLDHAANGCNTATTSATAHRSGASQFQLLRLQNRLAESPARPRERLSEVTAWSLSASSSRRQLRL